MHSCLNKNDPKLQSPASRPEKVSNSTFTWFLISSLFGTEVWDSVDSLNISSAFFLNARSRSVTCEDDGVVTCHMTSWHADTESLRSVRQGRHSERGAARSSWSGRACTRLLFRTNSLDNFCKIKIVFSITILSADTNNQASACLVFWYA